MENNQNTAVLTADAETVGALEFIDPATVVIDVNVRTETSLDKGFLTSIAERGVILPVVATRDDDGTVRVRDGQRRTLAARAADLATIPVYITGSDSDGDAATVERVTDQLIANEHRTDLSDRERAIGAQTLIDLGVSRTKVAKATSLGSPKAVDAAVATARSVTALDALSVGVTLEQAAIIAGYEDDQDTDAVEALLVAATEGRFEHVAARLVELASGRAAAAALVAEWVEQGYTASTDDLGDGWGAVSGLWRIDGERASGDDIASLTREHLAGVVTVEYEERWATADGQVIEDELIDYSTDGAPDDARPVDGLVDVRELHEVDVPVAEVSWWHNNPAVDGLETWRQRCDRRRAAENGTDTATPATDPGERARAETEAAQKRERSRLLALNKLGKAAQGVRRDALTAVLARKTLPKGTSAAVSRFVAETMWRRADWLQIARADGNTQAIASELLGGDPTTLQADASAERAQVITCAIVIAAHEANLPKDAWRTGDDLSWGCAKFRAAYLNFLTEVFGYTLSEVEQVVAGHITAESVSLD